MKITLFSQREVSRVIREAHATRASFDRLCTWLTEQGFTVHRSMVPEEANAGTEEMAVVTHDDPSRAESCGLLVLDGALDLPEVSYGADGLPGVATARSRPWPKAAGGWVTGSTSALEKAYTTPPEGVAWSPQRVFVQLPEPKEPHEPIPEPAVELVVPCDNTPPQMVEPPLEVPADVHPAVQGPGEGADHDPGRGPGGEGLPVEEVPGAVRTRFSLRDCLR